MNELQFWTKNRKKVLRVQQSMNGPYRVVAISSEDATRVWVSKYTIPAWANSYRDKADAVKELHFAAERMKLEKYEENAASAGGTAKTAHE